MRSKRSGGADRDAEREEEPDADREELTRAVGHRQRLLLERVALLLLVGHGLQQEALRAACVGLAKCILACVDEVELITARPLFRAAPISSQSGLINGCKSFIRRHAPPPPGLVNSDDHPCDHRVARAQLTAGEISFWWL